MANNCCYDMKVVGKQEDVNEFILMLKCKHSDCNKRLGRVFSAEEYDYGYTEDGRYYSVVCGDCAWSVSSAMLSGSFLTIDNISEMLNLEIEIWASEYGIGFQEHYIYDHGYEDVNECLDATEYWMESMREEYDTREEANEETGADFTEDEWNSYDDVIRGGFGDEFGKFSI